MTTRYTLHLASKTFSSWSLRPWLAMKMANIAFTETVTPLYTPETKDRIAPLSPSGKLPALEIEENGARRTVWDSLAICETLAERHPDARLWPENPARRAEARSMAAEMHGGFPDVRKTLPMDVTRKTGTPDLNDDVCAQIARIAALWSVALERFGGEGGFLFGHFTIADAFYAPVVTRFDTYGIALPAPVDAYAARILALRPMRDWTAAAKAEAV